MCDCLCGYVMQRKEVSCWVDFPFGVCEVSDRGVPINLHTGLFHHFSFCCQPHRHPTPHHLSHPSHTLLFSSSTHPSPFPTPPYPPPLSLVRTASHLEWVPTDMTVDIFPGRSQDRSPAKDPIHRLHQRLMVLVVTQLDNCHIRP